MTGNEYKKLIGRYIVAAYGQRGLEVYEEVSLGTSIIGKQRRIDLFVLGPDAHALCVECKYQDSSGTADEKIPYALNDMAAQRIPGVIVYAGNGFSAGVLHLLQGSEYAAYCLPNPDILKPVGRGSGPMSSGTWQLDHIIAQTFKFWDVILGNKRPLTVDPQSGVRATTEQSGVRATTEQSGVRATAEEDPGVGVAPVLAASAKQTEDLA